MSVKVVHHEEKLKVHKHSGARRVLIKMYIILSNEANLNSNSNIVIAIKQNNFH